MKMLLNKEKYMTAEIKGQLISKGLIAVFICTKKERKYFCISALERSPYQYRECSGHEHASKQGPADVLSWVGRRMGVSFTTLLKVSKNRNVFVCTKNE